MEYMWVILALIAAILQTSRNGLMKHLKARLDDEAIMLSRFMFSLPFLLVFLAGFHFMGNYPLPSFNRHFLLYMPLAAISQTIAGWLFLKMLSRRNFAVGVTYAQTNAMMQALFAALLFGEIISVMAGIAIFCSFTGIVMITMVEKHLEPKSLLKRIFTPSAFLGIGSGVFFGFAGVFIRQSVLALEGGVFFVNAAFTLCFVLALQTTIMSGILAIKKKEQLQQVFQCGYHPYLVGCSNAISSFCFFMAFSLTQAAYVSMVAQVEVVLSIFLTHKVFKEKMAPLELAGIVIMVSSIILLVSVH